MNFIIRQEIESDYESTEKVVETAFSLAKQGDWNEHHMVSRVRNYDTFVPELSLVAIDIESGQILGHILLSKISISDRSKKVESLALAPVSVLPDYQKQGIGKSLIHRAIQIAKKIGFQSVIVLGHPEYYPKFGFQKSSLWQIRAPFEVPDDALMAIELHKGVLDGVSGVIEYPSVFFE